MFLVLFYFILLVFLQVFLRNFLYLAEDDKKPTSFFGGGSFYFTSKDEYRNKMSTRFSSSPKNNISIINFILVNVNVTNGIKYK